MSPPARPQTSARARRSRVVAAGLLAGALGCAGAQEPPASTLGTAPIATFPLGTGSGVRRVTVGLWKASFSPDGRRLVVGRIDRGLEIVDLGTGARTRLTQFGKDPAWSPDGRLVAFVEGHSNAEEVWLIEAAGGQPWRLIKGGFPSWSADGKRVFFSTRPQGHVHEIAAEPPGAAPRPLFTQASTWYPAVSPDEKLIAFGVDGDLVVVDHARGVEVARAAMGSSGGLFVHWSPEGEWIAVGPSEGGWISLFAPATREIRRVVAGPFTMPAFSRDGRLMAFDQRLRGTNDVWITDQIDRQPRKPREPRERTIGVGSLGVRTGVLKASGGNRTRPSWRWRRMPMPELALPDLGGRVWKLADLEGKVTFVNVWATWCGPCRQELPLVQRLHDSLKGRPDAVVISLNVDDDAERARRYAADNKLTVPVVSASSYVTRIVGPALTIPRNWIVGPRGVMTAELRGYDATEAEVWLQAARDEMERARTAPAPGR
jgi:Tol biopolymer transport system component